MTYRLRNIGIAVALAVVAALLTTFYVTNYKRTVQHGEQKVPVYVASHDIALGTSGTDVAHRNLLRVEQVPRRSVVPGAISQPDQLDKLVAVEPTDAVVVNLEIELVRSVPHDDVRPSRVRVLERVREGFLDDAVRREIDRSGK